MGRARSVLSQLGTAPSTRWAELIAWTCEHGAQRQWSLGGALGYRWCENQNELKSRRRISSGAAVMRIIMTTISMLPVSPAHLSLPPRRAVLTVYVPSMSYRTVYIPTHRHSPCPTARSMYHRTVYVLPHRLSNKAQRGVVCCERRT